MSSHYHPAQTDMDNSKVVPARLTLQKVTMGLRLIDRDLEKRSSRNLGSNTFKMVGALWQLRSSLALSKCRKRLLVLSV